MYRGLAIDYESADRITCANLMEHRDILKGQLDRYDEGHWLHPDDVVSCRERVDAMNVLIKYFGS